MSRLSIGCSLSRASYLSSLCRREYFLFWPYCSWLLHVVLTVLFMIVTRCFDRTVHDCYTLFLLYNNCRILQVYHAYLHNNRPFLSCHVVILVYSLSRLLHVPNTLLAFVQTLFTTLTILPENVMIKNGIYLYKLFWNSWYWEDFNSWFRLFLTVGVATDRGARENIIVSSRQNILTKLQVRRYFN